MINARNLRPGNKIVKMGIDYDEGGGAYHASEDDEIITVLDFEHLKAIEQDEFSYDPVPLTPEILEKCGAKYPYNFYQMIDSQVLCYEYTIQGMTLMSMKKLMDLHDLQNLYHFETDQELEIKGLP